MNEGNGKPDMYAMGATSIDGCDDNNIKRLTLFLYGAAGYPPTSTLIKAIKRGHYATWPGFTVKRINKYIHNNEKSIMGHLQLRKQTKKKLGS